MTEELDIISRVRSDVLSRRDDTGTNLFLVWGYPTVVVLLLEFTAQLLWNANWYEWLWVGIPLVGIPLMMFFMKGDYERTHRRTLNENIALQLWLFIGGACCLGGFFTGFAGVYEQCFSTIEGLLVSLGCFLTGVISRLHFVEVCGIFGAVLSFLCLFFQGDLWPWQLLVTAVSVVFSLIIPGHYFKSLSQQHESI